MLLIPRFFVIYIFAQSIKTISQTFADEGYLTQASSGTCNTSMGSHVINIVNRYIHSRQLHVPPEMNNLCRSQHLVISESVTTASFLTPAKC